MVDQEHIADEEQETEDRIFHAAREVFFEHGFDGARMAEISRRAGINQSMLHYYYRSKSLLFDTVFKKAIQAAIPPVIALLKTEKPLLEKIDDFAHGHIDMVVANPHLPAFILQELRRKPDALRQFVGTVAEDALGHMKADVERSVARGEIGAIDARHLITNVLALCIFPFIARPMLQTALSLDDPAFDGFIQERKSAVSQFIHAALRP